MKARFSSQELFDLRNNIPVDMLIRDQLQIPSKIREGFFCFLCPICNEFQTAVNPNTNLARCFGCEKNFNTIDLVIAVKKCGFKDSVLFLKTLSMPKKMPAEVLKAFASGIGRPMP
jgi:DNA primase